MNGIEFKKLRKKNNLTQEDLALKLDLTRKTIGLYEKIGVPNERIDQVLHFFDNYEPYDVTKENILRGEIVPISDNTVDVLVNGNGNKYFINENGIIQIEVINIPFPAYASYLEVYNDEKKVIEEFGTARFFVDKIGKGYYISFDIKGDSMNGGGINDTPDKAKVLAREIGRHLWGGVFRKELYGYILMTDSNIYHKDITHYDELTGEITLSSRNEMCQDFTININNLKRLFNVIKRAF